MNSKELDLFCEIYEDKTILDKFSLIDIMLDIQIKTKDLQGIMSSPFSSSSTGSTNYDDLIYNTIDRLKYDRGANIEYIDKWLKEFEIGIDDIVKNNLGSNEIGKYINVKYNDFQGTQESQQKAHLIQVEFLDYFLKLYASNFLPRSYSGFDGRHKNEWIIIKQDEYYNVEFLNCFCKSIFDEIPAIKISFNLNYENNIKNFASKLHDEISDNVLRLSNFKIRVYLDYISTTINRRQLKLISSDYLNDWIEKYSLDIENFPYFNNTVFNLLLNKDYLGEHSSVEERREVFKIQRDFFLYASMIESNKILNFIDSLKTSLEIPLEKKSTKPEAVIVDPIFKSKDSLSTFNLIINELFGSNDNAIIKQKKAQAKLDAIWSCPASKSEIFKEFIDKKDYLDYLNKRLEVGYTSRSISDGSRYHTAIKNWLISR
jgi:hypothetical protein